MEEQIVISVWENCVIFLERNFSEEAELYKEKLNFMKRVQLHNCSPKTGLLMEMPFSVSLSSKILSSCNSLWVSRGLQRLFATLPLIPSQYNTTTHVLYPLELFAYVYSIFWWVYEFIYELISLVVYLV